ncbi:MAG: hypothetical protein OJF52_001055 [Nitrospira sp.]|nr:MAG: hypothetical protein OJF52_001055 [Nitrospira sp.]
MDDSTISESTTVEREAAQEYHAQGAGGIRKWNGWLHQDSSRGISPWWKDL